MIAIIDYGAGNIQSVNKALKYIGCDCVVTRDKDMILKADGAVLPESPNKKGLSVFDGSITKIPADTGLKIPHIGWNSLDIVKKDGIFKGIEDNAYVYFVHSYFLTAKNPEIVAARTNYGVQIDAAIEWENVSATQFHPEKSGEVGLKILKNFADMVNGK